MTAPRILSVEDDPKVIRVMDLYFQEVGWAFAWSDGDDLITDLESFRPSIVLLDWVLARTTGPELLKQLRTSAFRELPVIMISGRKDDLSIITGLDQGADEYITEPFRLAVLKARIESLLRRASGRLADYDFGTLRVDFSARSVTVEGKPVSLGQREWLLLVELVRSPFPVARQDLITRVWGEGHDATPAALDKAISRLKAALHAPSANDAHVYIETIHGFGYGFVRKPRV